MWVCKGFQRISVLGKKEKRLDILRVNGQDGNANLEVQHTNYTCCCMASYNLRDLHKSNCQCILWRSLSHPSLPRLGQTRKLERGTFDKSME